MAADLGYVYDLRTNHVFLEHKCNFRLDLMYYKSLLITLKVRHLYFHPMKPKTRIHEIDFPRVLDEYPPLQ